MVTSTINNVRVKIPISGAVGDTNMELKQNWLDQLIAAFSTKNTPSTFVDVGVNIGQTLLRLKTIYPEMPYLGFEPNATCTAYVQQLIKANGFKHCTVQNLALSTEVAILQLEKDSDIDSRASLVANLRPDVFSTKETILALDYQSFYLDKDISFVKIDVEGAEYEVLKGMQKAIERYRPIITCEVLDAHDATTLRFTQERATQLCELLASWHYGIIRLHTDASTILNYEKIETIRIVQWTADSLYNNDYIFYHTTEETRVLEQLQGIRCLDR